MKKRFSKLISSVLMMMLVLGVVPVQAAELETNVRLEETEVETSVQPRAALCLDCGIGTMVFAGYSEWTPWKTVSESDCVHHPYGADLKQQRIRYKFYECTYCNVRLQSTKYTDTRIVCDGFS